MSLVEAVLSTVEAVQGHLCQQTSISYLELEQIRRCARGL